MRSGLLSLIGGITLILFAVIAAPAFIVWRAVQMEDAAVQFVVPGNVTVPIRKAGSYLLSHDYISVFEGRSYRQRPALPDGLQIEFVDPASGQKLAFFDELGFASSSDSDREESRSIARLELEEPTPTEIEIRILGDAEPHVFSFQPNPLGMLFSIFIKAGIIAVVGGMTGLLVMIQGIRRLSTTRQPAAV